VKELPAIAAFADRYRHRHEERFVLAMVSTEEADALRLFFYEEPKRWLAYYVADGIPAAFGVQPPEARPATVVIDCAGNIVEKKVGKVDWTAMHHVVDRLLAVCTPPAAS
jgi:hypothetical protein